MAKEVALKTDQLPSYLAGYEGPTGAESIDAADAAIPRIEIAQALHDEVKAGTLRPGDMFLNVTGEVLAKADEPLEVVVLSHFKEYVLWRPRKDGGGILARANAVKDMGVTRYAWDKNNQSFEVRVDGKTPVTWKTKRFIDEDGLDKWGTELPGVSDSAPAASTHLNYIVTLPKHGNIIAALSLSRTKIKRARDWNTMLKMGNAPMQARIFTITTEDDKSPSGDFKNIRVKPAGFVENQADFKRYVELAESFKGKVVNIDQSNGDADIEDARV